ncbi:MAG: hypothetical protein ACFE0Q_19635 [Anaerolineae bacterium]
MSRFGQVGIAFAALGVMVALMGLFPGVTGVEETPGIGVVQVFMLLAGYAMMTFGGLIYAKFTFYLDVKPTLSQQIGIRLMLTGLLFAAIAGLADILGFGSHVRSESSDIFFGNLQGIGIIACLTISSLGVVIYTVAGEPRISETALLDDLSTAYPQDLERITNEMNAITSDDLITPDQPAEPIDNTPPDEQSVITERGI